MTLLLLSKFLMTKRTLSNKSRYSILKLSGFRVRMKTADGRKIINKRRKKQRNRIALIK
jgi:ribosomal protein L34